MSDPKPDTPPSLGSLLSGNGDRAALQTKAILVEMLARGHAIEKLTPLLEALGVSPAYAAIVKRDLDVASKNERNGGQQRYLAAKRRLVDADLMKLAEEVAGLGAQGGMDPAAFADATVVAAEGREIERKGIPFLLHGLIPMLGMLGFLIARTKVGKTSFSEALGAAVSRGIEFIGRVTVATRVLYIAAEDPPEYTAWVARHLVTTPGAMTFYRKSVLLDDAGITAISEKVRDEGYGLVLIASWQSVVRGLVKDENDNAGAVVVVERVKDATRALGIPWLIEAHAGKGEDQADDADPTLALRGASAAAGSADYALSLRYADGTFGTKRRLSGNGRFVRFAPVTLDYDDSTGSYRSYGDTRSATVEADWLLVRKALTSEPQTDTGIAKRAEILSAKGTVTTTQRDRVKAALRNRPEVFASQVKGKGRGGQVWVYNLAPKEVPVTG